MDFDTIEGMITADQLTVHAIGDYILQSDWQAQNKTRAHFPAFCHALVYSLGFLVFTPSWKAWAVIFGTHFLIDRYRLACYLVWAKNFLSPKVWWKKTPAGWSPVSNQDARSWLTWHEIGKPGIFNKPIEEIEEIRKAPMLPFSECAATGYPPSTPAWLSVWLLIIADNICHILINGLALKFL